MKQNILNTLLEKIERLEKRLWGGEIPGGDCISEADLSRILKEAGRRFFLEQDEDGDPNALPLELTEAVNHIIDEQAEELGTQQLLSIRHAALIQLIEALFHNMEYSQDLDSEAYAAIRGLQICTARIALSDVTALDAPTRPLWQFLGLCLRACQGCDPHAGFRSQELLRRIEQGVREILTSPMPPEQACFEALQSFEEFHQQHERGAPPVEQSMVEKEQILAVQERWQQSVRSKAFRVLAGKRLPRAALEFFDQIWSEYLLGFSQWEGAEGEAWDRGVEAVHSLVASLSIRDPEQMLSYYSGMLFEVLDVFRHGAEKVRPNSPLTRSFLEQMERFCLQVVNGEEPDPAQMIDVPADAYDPEGVTVSDSESLARIGEMKEDDWYLIQGGGIRKRGKLIQKNQKEQYCLFVNYSGIKSSRMDFRQIAEGLEAGTIRPVEVKTVYKQALRRAVKQMAELVPQLKSKVKETEAQRQRLQEAKIEQKRREETLRKLREQQSREAAAARKKARQEAMEQARRQMEQRAEAVRETRERAMVIARGDVERMQAGGRLELIGEDRSKLVCELGVRLKSSQKMIFVDQLGRKQLSLLPEELAEKIAIGNARILDYGATFDDTLRGLIVEHSSRIQVE